MIDPPRTGADTGAGDVQENVEIVTRGFEHLLATGEPLWASIAADVEVHDQDSPP